MNRVARRMLQQILSMPCPAQIPRSGERGKKVNCYSVAVNEGDSPRLLLTGLSDQGYFGQYFDESESGFNCDSSIPYILSEGLSLRIFHYHGLVTHSYNGLLDYAAHEWTRFYKIQSIYVILKHHIPQLVFNRRSLQFRTRMVILEKILERQADQPLRPFSSMDILGYLYSQRWYMHPQGSRVRRKMDLYLASFESSGELRRNGASFEYFITGKAIATLEQYQIEVKRAESSRRSQLWLVILTAILAFFAAVQSGLVKSPVLIDLSDLIKFKNVEVHDPKSPPKVMKSTKSPLLIEGKS